MGHLPSPELLRAFVAVAERRSFTRAALELNRTQAAVSLQIKRLEEQVGLRLFWRSTSRVELTEAGRGLLADARQVLAVNERMLARLARRPTELVLRLGVMEDYGTRILPRLLLLAAQRFPEVKVELSLGLTAPMRRRLGASYDAVIAMHAVGAAAGELLRCEDCLWAAAPPARFAPDEPVPLALSVRACLLRRWAVAALSGVRRPWRLAFVSPSMSAVEALAARGLALTAIKCSMLPAGLRFVDAEAKLPALPCAEIRLHRTPGLAAPVARVLDMLGEGLTTSVAA
jgi:DNA-binding transcriptional LysR family regulator